MLLVYLSNRALKFDARDQELYRLARRIVIRARHPVRGHRSLGWTSRDPRSVADLTNAIVFYATLPSVQDQAEAE